MCNVALFLCFSLLCRTLHAFAPLGVCKRRRGIAKSPFLSLSTKPDGQRAKGSNKQNEEGSSVDDCTRRHNYAPSRRKLAEAIVQISTAALIGGTPALAAVASNDDSTTAVVSKQPTSSRVREIRDLNTYPALVYEPLGVSATAGTSNGNRSTTMVKPPPLLLVLHGAATNQETSVRKALGSPSGEHAGLPMQLLASDAAPAELADNFCVAAPYSIGKRSFYEDSRGNILNFIQYLADQQILLFDPTRIFLFGFSDGATVAVELATSRKFKGVVVASYGFTGESLPPLALQRLQGIGFWVWHSVDDVIFDVHNSDRLVAALQRTNGVGMDDGLSDDLVRYTRYDKDPLPGLGIPVDLSMRGHTMGIAAAQTPQLYSWLLSL